MALWTDDVFPMESYSKHSMYGIFTYIWLICMVNVGRYTIITLGIWVYHDSAGRHVMAPKKTWRRGKGRGIGSWGSPAPTKTNYPRRPKCYANNCLNVHHGLAQDLMSPNGVRTLVAFSPSSFGGSPKKRGSKICRLWYASQISFTAPGLHMKEEMQKCLINDLVILNFPIIAPPHTPIKITKRQQQQQQQQVFIVVIIASINHQSQSPRSI